MQIVSSVNVCAGTLLGVLALGLIQANFAHTRGVVEQGPIAAPAPRLPSGAPVIVRLGDSISPGAARGGDSWSGTTAREVVAVDGTRIPAGSAVAGIVTEARRGRAKLGLRMVSISAGVRIAPVRAWLEGVATAPFREGAVMVFTVR
jgi:hypothetical protein